MASPVLTFDDLLLVLSESTKNACYLELDTKTMSTIPEQRLTLDYIDHAIYKIITAMERSIIDIAVDASGGIPNTRQILETIEPLNVAIRELSCARAIIHTRNDTIIKFLSYADTGHDYV